ncbi:MAG: anti-sigma factor family protein [Bacillota bacterium]
MRNEHLEFSIMQYLDGTLPAEERSGIERLLATDPEARQILAEFQSLDNTLKNSLPMPAVKWDCLAKTISAAVDQQGQAAPIDEQTELALTQYMDAELNFIDRAAMEERLKTDSASRQVLDEYRTLDRLVKQAWPMPQVNWDRFSEHLSESVGEAAQQARYSLVWTRARAAMGVAVAACVFVAIGLAIRFHSPSPLSPQPPAMRVAHVTGPMPEKAPGAPMAQIEISGSNSGYSYSAAGVVRDDSSSLAIQIAYQKTPAASQENSLFQQ